MNHVIDTCKKPIMVWTDYVEASALLQAYNLANLPFTFHHVSLMPDVHMGYGMPIGGVLATLGVVIPNAVGVDIGCLDKDTEVLTPNGRWLKISEWQGEEILQYDKLNDTTRFAAPLRYINKSCDTFYHFKHTRGLDQMLSPDHKMLVWQGFKGRGYKMVDYIAKDFVQHHNSLVKGIQGGVKTTFSYTTPSSLELSDEDIRVQCMVSADGCLRERKICVNKAEIHVKKQRKVDRAIQLLTEAGIEFKRYDEKSGFTTFLFIPPVYDKSLRLFWKASKSQLNVLADECMYWDGHRGEHTYYSTTDKENAEVIQFALTVSGIRANIYEPAHKDNELQAYVVYQTTNEIVGFSRDCVTTCSSSDGRAYCFTTSTGYFVARRNGYIFITGNCGMIATRTNLRELKYLDLCRIMGGSKVYHGGIRSSIPVGCKHHTKVQDWEGFDRAPDIKVVQDEIQSARKQLGTLGGGNHFIEIQKGSDGFVWVMIHSGSRNFGYKIAKHYNKLAQDKCRAWHSDIPEFKGEDGLAFLPLQHELGQEYLAAMNYACEFALTNRQLMIQRVREAILAAMDYDVKFDNQINVHHNYARLEHHFGRDVMVHRKGATSARKGELGLIPGSQGTASYVVKGKGDPLSFNSCSHGAGRAMSRTRAKETLDLETEIARMNGLGVMHGMRSTDDLDEAAGAYKDIDTVMNHQKDLVDIVTKLTPMAVIKGPTRKRKRKKKNNVAK